MRPIRLWVQHPPHTLEKFGLSVSREICESVKQNKLGSVIGIGVGVTLLGESQTGGGILKLHLSLHSWGANVVLEKGTSDRVGGALMQTAWLDKITILQFDAAWRINRPGPTAANSSTHAL